MTLHGRSTEQMGGLLWDKLDQQTDARLREIIAECESRTTTNCGWVAYGLRDIVAAVAKGVLRVHREEGAVDTPDLDERGRE